MEKSSKKGFTLAELLIVVAIIGVLVAIAVPVFSGHVEKAKLTTELSNIRSAADQLIVDAMSADQFDENGTIHIPLSALQAAKAFSETAVSVPRIVATEGDSAGQLVTNRVLVTRGRHSKALVFDQHVSIDA